MIKKINVLIFTFLFTLGATFQNTLDDVLELDNKFETEQTELQEIKEIKEKLNGSHTTKRRGATLFHINYLNSIFFSKSIGNTLKFSFIPYIPPEMI